MNALLQAIGKHVASAPDKKAMGSKPSLPSKARVSSSPEDAVPSENEQPQDLHAVHAGLQGLVPDHVHKELGEAIAKHMASKGA